MEDYTEESKENDSLREDYLSFPHQLQNNKMLDKKEWDEKKIKVEEEFLNFLKNINKEALQLSEFLLEENRLTHELCAHLKQILTRLNLSLAIPVKAIPPLEGIKKIILNAQKENQPKD
ncbi:MAG: hypothetical protein QW231_00245 [Candidatus Bathyarchaeia archaeon]